MYFSAKALNGPVPVCRDKLPRIQQRRDFLIQWAGRSLFFFALFLGGFCSSGGVSSAGETPYKIGFVGGLTGRNADLGIQGRNGALLAVEEINRGGGVHGRPFQLIARDDRQDPKTAVRVDRELIREGVVAIIGHMTSSMTQAVLPLINEQKVVLISPSASANALAGIDDYFLRVLNPSGRLSNLVAEYAYGISGVRRLAVIFDRSNRAYTEEVLANFRSAFERLGGRVVSVTSYTTGPSVSFKKLSREIFEENPDGILIVACALDTAMLCQHIRMKGSKVPIFISGWAQTDDLLRHGGPAVEGVIGAQNVYMSSVDKTYAAFKERFQTRFGTNGPTFAAGYAYDAVMVIQAALAANPDPRFLKQTILKLKAFQSVQGPFEIDPYGDGKRKACVVTVSDHRFRDVE